MDAEVAKKTWELENNVESIPASDDIFKYDAAGQSQVIFLYMKNLIIIIKC